MDIYIQNVLGTRFHMTIIVAWKVVQSCHVVLARSAHRGVIPMWALRRSRSTTNDLFEAIISGDLNAVDFALQRGVQLNGCDVEEMTPLRPRRAIRNCETEIACFLIANQRGSPSAMLCACSTLQNCARDPRHFIDDFDWTWLISLETPSSLWNPLGTTCRDLLGDFSTVVLFTVTQAALLRGILHFIDLRFSLANAEKNFHAAEGAVL